MKERTDRHMVYKMINLSTGENITLYFLPDDDWERKLRRQTALTAYKLDGFVVKAFAYATKEEYLNMKLNEKVKDYLEVSANEDRYRKMYLRNEIPQEVAVQSIQICTEQELIYLKSIHSLLRRLFNADLECHNELAIELDNYYISTIL